MNDTLTTIAEVSVAIVGFVAIVTALGRDQERAGIHRVLIVNVIAEPVAVVMFALLPLIVQTAPIDETLALRFCLSLFALVHLYLNYWVYRRFMPYFDVSFPRTGPTLVCVAAAAICLVQLMIVAGVGLRYLQLAYLVGLYWLLAMCFLNFLSLFLMKSVGNQEIEVNSD